MSLIIKRKAVDYRAMESGTYIARCVVIAGVGTQEEQDFKTKVPRYVDEVYLVFEIIGYNRTHKDGSPFMIRVKGKDVPEPQTIRGTYTRSLGAKAKLARHLSGWLGKDPGSFASFDLESECLNKPCILNINKRVSESTGNEYNTIESISPLVRGMGEPGEAVMEPVCYDINDHDDDKFYALPVWLQEVVKRSSEWADMNAASETINIEDGHIETIGGPEF